MSLKIPLYAKNDCNFTVDLTYIDVNGNEVPFTTGTVTGFIATTSLPTATAADPTLSVTCTHIGEGRWLVAFPAFNSTLLDPLFGTTTPWFIVTDSVNIRVAFEGEYNKTREGVVEQA